MVAWPGRLHHPQVSCPQRWGRSAPATRSSLSARTIVHGNELASSTRWARPNHGCRGVPTSAPSTPTTGQHDERGTRHQRVRSEVAPPRVARQPPRDRDVPRRAAQEVRETGHDVPARGRRCGSQHLAPAGRSPRAGARSRGGWRSRSSRSTTARRRRSPGRRRAASAAYFAASAQEVARMLLRVEVSRTSIATSADHLWSHPVVRRRAGAAQPRRPRPLRRPRRPGGADGGRGDVPARPVAARAAGRPRPPDRLFTRGLDLGSET